MKVYFCIAAIILLLSTVQYIVGLTNALVVPDLLSARRHASRLAPGDDQSCWLMLGYDALSLTLSQGVTTSPEQLAVSCSSDLMIDSSKTKVGRLLPEQTEEGFEIWENQRINCNMRNWK
jgi:hypothetical protein